jgi:hypothetical protein
MEIVAAAAIPEEGSLPIKPVIEQFKFSFSNLSSSRTL